MANLKEAIKQHILYGVCNEKVESDIIHAVKRLNKYAEIMNDEPLKATIIEIFGVYE